MKTQQFMGSNQLIERLTAQVGGNRDMAIELLRKRGQMEPNSEKLTAAGQARNAMTAEERAKDRASKATGKPASKFTYNPATNRALLGRKRKG